MLFAVAGVSYRATLLDARSQFFLLRRLMPILPALDSIGQLLRRKRQTDASAALAAIAPLVNAGEDDLAFVIDHTLSSCERKVDDEWLPAIEFADHISLSDTLQIVAHVVAFNYRLFFAVKRPQFDETWIESPDYKPAALPDGTDWLFRPVLRKLCSYVSLRDGTLHIEDVAEMNNLLDVADENQRRAHEAAERGRN